MDDPVRSSLNPATPPRSDQSQQTYLDLTPIGLVPGANWSFAISEISATSGFAEAGPVPWNQTVNASVGIGLVNLTVVPPHGYIAIPITATFDLTAGATVGEEIQFLPSYGCYFFFTEVGLPIGTEWWALYPFGLAYFSNGTTIEGLGCGFVQDIPVGSYSSYQVVSELNPGYVTTGSVLAAYFAAPSNSPAFPAFLLLIGSVLLGIALGVEYVSLFPKRPPKSGP